MADKLLRLPSELEVQTTVRALIYGQAGVGKSTLALSAPSPVLLDFDNGVHRIATVHQVPTLQVRDYQQFKDLLKSGELSPFKTIVIDTVGKMLDYMGAWLIANNPNAKPSYVKRDGNMSQAGYGARKYEFINVLRDISIMGKHLVFVAHDREERDGETRIVRPDIGGSSGGDLIRELDLVGYMEAIGKDITISFDPCEKFYGKNTCHLPPSIKVPVILDNGAPVAPNTFLSDVFAQYHANLDARRSVAEQYDILMDLITAMVSDADVEGLNVAVEKIPTFEVIWDSPVRAKRMISIRAKALGAVFDKDKGAYVIPDA